MSSKYKISMIVYYCTHLKSGGVSPEPADTRWFNCPGGRREKAKRSEPHGSSAKSRYTSGRPPVPF